MLGFISTRCSSYMNVPLTVAGLQLYQQARQDGRTAYRLPSHGPVAHLVIDATGPRSMAKANGKFASTASEKRRVWRKLHLAVDAATHAIVAAEVSPETVGDNEVLPTLLNPLRRKIEQVSADGAYDTRVLLCPTTKKGVKATIPPRKECGILEERPSTQRGGCRAQGRRAGAMEKDLAIISAR